MKNLNQVVVLIFATTIFLSCQTTRYHEPVELSQDEIKKLKPFETATQIPREMKSGKYYTCDKDKKENCMVTICSNNPAKETGLECKVFIPVKSSDSSSKTAQYENKEIKKTLDEKLAVYKTDESQTKDFCNKDNVICYMDSKIFPNNKLATAKTYSVITYKNSYDLIKNGEHKLEVTVYEIK